MSKSATEEVRARLDAMGVEWMGTDYTEPTSGHATNTSLGHEHHDAVFAEYVDGTVLRLFDLTPEQAIAATLGDADVTRERQGGGTCHAEETEHVDISWQDGRRLTIHVMECDACGGTYEHVNGSYEYCPRCGAKVVDE